MPCKCQSSALYADIVDYDPGPCSLSGDYESRADAGRGGNSWTMISTLLGELVSQAQRTEKVDFVSASYDFAAFKVDRLGRFGELAAIRSSIALEALALLATADTTVHGEIEASVFKKIWELLKKLWDELNSTNWGTPSCCDAASKTCYINQCTIDYNPDGSAYRGSRCVPAFDELGKVIEECSPECCEGMSFGPPPIHVTVTAGG